MSMGTASFVRLYEPLGFPGQPWWRNGIRARLKIVFSQGIEGSSPSHGTRIYDSFDKSADALLRSLRCSEICLSC